MWKLLFRCGVLVGSMVLGDSTVAALCPNAKGVVKFTACLAATTIFGAAADMGAKHALEVLEGAQQKLKGC